MEYKEYFKPPFKMWTSSKVFTSEFDMAFDFAFKMLDPNAFETRIENKRKIVRILNGSKEAIKMPFVFSRNKSTILINNKPLMWIRGWGKLTGTGGGLGLSSELAFKIQCDFGDFIVKELNDAVKRGNNKKKVGLMAMRLKEVAIRKQLYRPLFKQN